jgi:biopolymer transport protein ExbB
MFDHERRFIVLSIVEAAGWPIWFLLLCSVLALAIIIERFYSLREYKIIPKNLLDEVISICRQGIPSGDVIQKLEESSVQGLVLAAGLRAYRDPICTQEDLHGTFEAQGRLAAHGLEKFLNALGTIATAAPLLGLFGTVVGMIEIFGAQAQTQSGNPVQLAHGISVALYNTAFGLLIAIPSLICWRYFRSLTNYYLLVLELSAEKLAHHLSGLRK